MCVAAAFLPLKQADLLRGRTIGVMGLGPAGLVAAQLARAEGAATVIGFEPNPNRRSHAAAVTDAAVDPGASDIGQVDGIIDCVGLKKSVEGALDRARHWVALFGVQREDYTFAVRHYTKTLHGYPGHSGNL